MKNEREGKKRGKEGRWDIDSNLQHINHIQTYKKLSMKINEKCSPPFPISLFSHSDAHESNKRKWSKIYHFLSPWLSSLHLFFSFLPMISLRNQKWCETYYVLKGWRMHNNQKATFNSLSSSSRYSEILCNVLAKLEGREEITEWVF